MKRRSYISFHIKISKVESNFLVNRLFVNKVWLYIILKHDISRGVEVFHKIRLKNEFLIPMIILLPQFNALSVKILFEVHSLKWIVRKKIT